MRPPSNIITSNYTIGNEFVFLNSKEIYQGYYYEINRRYYAGKTFNPVAPELTKITFNTFPKSISISPNVEMPLPNSSDIPYIIPDARVAIRYFTKQTNPDSIIIREISKETFDNLQSNPNPLYQTISLDFSSTNLSSVINEANKRMPGLIDFLRG